MSDNSFSRPKSLLTRQNYLEWTRDWALCLPSYGTAGDEVTKQKATIEFLHKPLVGDRMWQIEEDENGGEVWVQVEMTEYQKRQVPTRLATWKSEYEKYKKARGALINNIMNSIDESLRITIMNQPTYTDLTQKSDSVGLWKLITQVMQSQGASQQDLINQWNNLRQLNTSTGQLEDIQVHINMFEQILININCEANGITDRRKAEQLIKSVSLSKYESIIGNWILMIEQPEEITNPFPKYNVVKDKIMKYDEILSKSDKVLSTSSTSTVMNGFSSVAYGSSISAGNGSTVTCLNCGRRGHIRRDCMHEPVKCSRIGCKQWHPTQFHDKLASQHSSVIMSGGRQSYHGREYSAGPIRTNQTLSKAEKGREIRERTFSDRKTAASSFSPSKAFKKPTNVKAKILSQKPEKKVYFTYTDEEGNCIDDKIYEEIQEDPSENEDGPYTDNDEIPDEEQI